MAVPAHKTEYFIIENSNLQKKANTAVFYRSFSDLSSGFLNIFIFL